VSSAVFVPYALFGGDPDPVLFVRAVGPMAAVMADVVARAEAERPFLRPVRVQTAAAMLGDTIRSRRLQSWLFGSLAAAGLLVAGVGLLGLAAMAMARRTREIGIRMALGATRDRVVAGLVSEHAIPVAAGVAGGLLVAVWAVGFVEAYVYELSVYDARIWIAAVAAVSATALIGALVPSLRATRVDPVRALRVE
jgi:ABC-type antimicrobial peptide transport system permease subunit